jgi:hypothetical protein
MPRGSKAKYTEKQKRKAQHIEEGYLERGLSKKTAAARAWATVNKQDGGGKQPGGSGRSKSRGAKSAKSASRSRPARRNPGSPRSSHRAAARSTRNERSRRTARTAHQPDVYLPTRAQIARSCREIQSGWSEATRRQRDGYQQERIVLTPVHLDLEPEAFERAAWD